MAGDKDEIVNITASSMIEVLAGQVKTLRTITIALENALSTSLCNCNPLDGEALQSFQRVDFLRQSLQDIEAILLYVSEHMSWHADSSVTVDGLLRSVHMRDSLKDIVHSLPEDAKHGCSDADLFLEDGLDSPSASDDDDDIWL
ncbi:MAG: hypothetical protein ACRBBT_10050 [Paracoccaceae bacterium]